MFDKRSAVRNARRALHATLQIPASYYAPPAEQASAVPVHVRYTTAASQTGNDLGRSYYAHIDNPVDKLIFMADEMVPVRGAVVALDVAEAYRIDNVPASDDITVTANVTRLSPDDAASYAPPSATAAFPPGLATPDLEARDYPEYRRFPLSGG